MDGEKAPEAAPPQASEHSEKTLAFRARHRLRNIGALIASVAAVGAVASGLVGYWNVWKTIKTDVLRQGAPSQATGLTISMGPSVAVLPFVNGTGDPAKDLIADEMTDDVIAGLAKFKALRVASRGETAKFRSNQSSPGDVRAATGADYVVEGVVRDGEKPRLLVHLTDAATGRQVWSKLIETPPANKETTTPTSIAGLAASFIGAPYGAMTAAEYQKIKEKPAEQLTSFQCIIMNLGGAGASQWDASIVTKARSCAERLVKSEPQNASAWAALAGVYNVQRWWGLGLKPEEMKDVDKRGYLNDMAREAASKAVELDPTDAYAHRLLATANIAGCRLAEGELEAKRSLELNPNDPLVPAFLGSWLAFSGELDRGVKIVENAMAISGPGFALWWWDATAVRDFVRGNYDAAVYSARKAYVPQFWNAHVTMAYMLEAAGRHDDAKNEVASILKLRPGFTIREANSFYRMWCFKPDYIDKMNGFLRAAGLPE